MPIIAQETKEGRWQSCVPQQESFLTIIYVMLKKDLDYLVWWAVQDSNLRRPG